MRKKDLLKMPQLLVTDAMLQVARENPATIQRRRYSLWGKSTEYRVYKYLRYLRAVVQNGILKVAVFSQSNMENGTRYPLYEVYCDKSENKFITYELAADKWREAKIDFLEYPGNTYIFPYKNWQQEADRALVNEYFDTGISKDIYAAVLSFQCDIRKDALNKRHRNEIEQIDEVMREVPELPADFERWVIKNAFNETMFYEPDSMCHGRWPKMYCTHCKKWMDAGSYPNKPKHGESGKCPQCKSKITYRSWNRQLSVREDADVGILQRLKDDSGWIMRKFSAYVRRWKDKGWENEELDFYEWRRVRLANDFTEQEGFEFGEFKTSGVYRWCHECRNSQWGYYAYPRNYGYVNAFYTNNLKRQLKREVFGGMDFKNVMRSEKAYFYPAEIMRILYMFPFIEYVQKAGLDRIAEQIMSKNISAGLFDKEKQKIHEVLKLDKQRYQRLRKLNGDREILQILQYEQTTGNKISDQNMEFIKKNEVDVDDIITLCERTGMNAQRMMNYIEKQMEIEGQEYQALRRHYRDYLDMAEEFGMDITDEIVCHQSRMMFFHDRYTARKNRTEWRKRDAEVDKKYPGICANHDKYAERFKWSNKELEIVVPRKASDITKEGRQQHHCVGSGDRYISNMNQEQRFILFLRRKSDLKKPYYTLEVTWDGDIKQFYAAYDRQPDKEKIKKVLEKFTAKVKKREEQLQKKMHEVEERDGTKATRIGTQYYMELVEAI